MGAVCCVPRQGHPLQPPDPDPNVENDVIALRQSIGVLQGVVQDLREDVTQIREARSRSGSILMRPPGYVEGCGALRHPRGEPGLTLGGEPLSPRKDEDYSPQLSGRCSARSARSSQSEGLQPRLLGSAPHPFFEMTPTRPTAGSRRRSAPCSEASTAADSAAGGTALLYSLSPRGPDGSSPPLGSPAARRFSPRLRPSPSRP